MIYNKYIPKYPLNNYVDCMVYVEGNNKGVGFPKTAMSLVFNLNDSFKLFTDSHFTDFIEYRKYWVAGLQTRPSYVENYGESKMLVIQFKTLGAYIFLNQPLTDFTNNYIDLDCVFKNEADNVWEQLKEAETIDEKFITIENFLYGKFLKNKTPNEKLRSSINLMFSNKENISIKEICMQYNISRKHLNFLFREYLGVSPKMLFSLNRFQRILQSIKNSKPDKLTQIAYELEYFDQAHFNNNFRRFTGLRPNEYIRFVDIKPSLKIVPHFVPVE